MDLNTLQECLSGLPLGSLSYFDSLGSTNVQAMHWIEAGAPHLSLVVANEQTAGRGRQGRRWHTRPGGALAFSLVLRADMLGAYSTSSRLTGLGALAVCDALHEEYALPAKIKWPNDVLVGGRKLAGVLVEASWQGEEFKSAVVGIGINVALDSVPPDGELEFPATSVEAALGNPIDRWMLLRAVLEAFITWLPHWESAKFLQSWDEHLAYRHDWVQLIRGGREPVVGRLLGLGEDGSLQLALPSGKVVAFPTGDVSLRIVDRS